MAYSTKTLTIGVSLLHLMLGVLCLVFGVVAIKMKEIDYNDGLHGMGIWLGLLMLLHALCGLLVAREPIVKCRISCYIAFCCLSVVVMMVCCIPLITGPIIYFSFESKANKDYYRQYGPESTYHKPQSYFDERNRIGSVGCGIYGTILFVVLLDILIISLSCSVWKRALNNLQARQTPRSRAPAGPISLDTSNYHYNGSRPQHVIVIQDGFGINHGFPKLPRYIDLYPDRDLALENHSCDPSMEPPPNQPLPSHGTAPVNPPPYSEICNIPNALAADNPTANEESPPVSTRF